MDRDEWIDPRKSAMTLREWIPEWWDIAGIELLVEGTRRAYRTDIELHILPAFGKYSLVELADADAKVARWVTKQHADYAHSTADNRTALFSSILHEAVIRHRMRRNPLARSRRRGRKTSRAMHAREKVWATPLQVLLIAERAALFARGDTTTFIMLITKAYTGMRGREIVGLERPHVHRCDRGPGWQLDVEWQLKEYPGRLARELPKDESRRPNDLPSFLVDLLHIEMSGHDGVCGCSDHDGGPYVFRGTGRSPHITSSTLDYRFRAAACGLYYSQSNKKDLPVSVTTDAFPGLPTHGHGRADGCWVPILPGATPHSLRHSQRTWMDDDQIPESLKHQRLGHSVPGMSGAYGHTCPEMPGRRCARR